MLLRCALKNIKRSKLMSVLTVCEMTCAAVITLVMVSSVMIRFRNYTPFRDMFESNGLYCEFSSAANKDFYGENKAEDFIADDDILQFLHSPESIAACNTVSCGVQWDNGLLEVNNFSYNDEVIRRFAPKLKSGRWLKESTKADCIECVVSKNEYGWEEGSSIQIDLGGKNYTAQVVGVLEENAKLPGGFAVHSTGDDFNAFFNPYSCEIEQKPLIVFSSQYLQKQGAVQGLFSGCLITYPDSVTKDQLKEDQQTLAKFGCAYSMPLTDLDKNSKLYLYRHLYDMLPIIIVILVLAFVSSVSSSALTMRTRLKDYAVFCICGMRWKQCVLIELIRSAVLAAVSLVLSLAAVSVVSKQFSMSVVWSGISLVSIAVILLMFLLVSLAAPYYISKTSTPKQLLGQY